ncbi:protein starmaker-like [Mercenaria mercenaria]|uniref:protein starmaker-like n=1 Tax=Mercenaria mercenaria TaxID=6596 RepID=UPI00234F635E|nr:protein starmaker-like [Mercenaria mercenaria]
MEEATDDANKPPSVNEGDNKRDKVEKPADDANKPPSESEQDTTENTENNEGETAGITDTRRPPSEQEDVITNGEEDDSSYSNNNEGDNNRDQEENAADDANNLSVLNERGNTENTEHRNEETTDDTCKPPSESEQDTIENTENNEGETAGITDTRRPPWKQGDAVTNSANVSDTPEAKKQEDAAAHGTNDDTPEAKKQENAVTHGVNHDTPEAKEIRHVSNFDELFQKEQKKTIMDAKKLVEKHLSEEIEKTGTDLIVQEHGIDMEKQKSVVEYIKKCVNICWSMHRNEPPVFVEFPDNTEDIKFDTNKFKPYTKSGTYIDYIVWPAVYLHEGGPLLCKGVAQGRK